MLLLSGLPTLILSAMLNDPRTRDTTHTISVTSNLGLITLQGSVPSEKARQAAEEIAREIPGVVYVGNDLTVDHRQDGGSG